RRAVERLEAGDRDEVPGVVRRALDAIEGRCRTVERRVEAHDAERARAAGDQRAGHRVGPVAELLHGQHDALARLRAHVVAVVDYARDGLVRNAREPGDVGHDRPALAWGLFVGGHRVRNADAMLAPEAWSFQRLRRLTL